MTNFHLDMYVLDVNNPPSYFANLVPAVLYVCFISLYGTELHCSTLICEYTFRSAFV